jgi:transposase
MSTEQIEISSKLPTETGQLQRLFVQTAQKYNQVIEENAHLKSELDWLKRHVFGRRSERYLIDPNQSVLPGIEAPVPAETVGETLKLVKAKPKNGHGRQPLPAHLPRQQEILDVPASAKVCACCGKTKDRIGEEKTEEVDFQPASVFVREIIRPKYACKSCGDGVVIASLPSRPIEKGRPGPGLLAQVCIGKYADHLPLHRQVGIFKRSGVDIPKSTMVDWVRGVYELLYPITRVMKYRILQSFCVKSDDTPIKVQTNEKKHQTHQGAIWTYLGMDCDQVVFEYKKSRNKDGPTIFLHDYQGYLQADAYGGYDECFQTGKIIEVGCWAHARRYFFEALSTDKALAEEMMGKIKRLFAVESSAKEEKLDAEGVRKKREKESRPILEDIKTWLTTQRGRVLPQSPIGKAVTYALNQWEALMRYLEDGRLDIDNNASERAIRAVAIGRKNWLFAGSHEGAERTALMYSLVGSCRLLKIDPFEYLRDVINRIADHPMKRIEELTPWGWKKFRENNKV